MQDTTHGDDSIQEILKKEMLQRTAVPPFWAALRAFVQDPVEPPTAEESAQIHAAMKSLSDEGKVVLWKLTLTADSSEQMAISKPDLDLQEDLESRQAWATAERYVPEE